MAAKAWPAISKRALLYAILDEELTAVSAYVVFRE